MIQFGNNRNSSDIPRKVNFRKGITNSGILYITFDLGHNKHIPEKRNINIVAPLHYSIRRANSKKSRGSPRGGNQMVADQLNYCRAAVIKLPSGKLNCAKCSRFLKGNDKCFESEDGKHEFDELGECIWCGKSWGN